MDNEELHKLYNSPAIIWVIILRRDRRGMGKMKNAPSILVGKPEGRRSLGRPKSGWEDNIRMDLRVRGWEGVDSIHLDQDGV
jgi:hypothetical protein